MNELWALQWILNGFLIVVAFRFLLRRTPTSPEIDSKLKVLLKMLERRTQECESRLEVHHARMKRQFETLKGVCDQASHILKDASVPAVALAASDEKQELLELSDTANAATPSAEPSSEQQKIPPGVKWEVRTVLADQLA